MGLVLRLAFLSSPPLPLLDSPRSQLDKDKLLLALPAVKFASDRMCWLRLLNLKFCSWFYFVVGPEKGIDHIFRVCVKARGRWKLCQCGGTKVRQKQAARTAQQHAKQPATATTTETTTTARQTDSSIDRGTDAGWQRQIQEQRKRKKIIIKCVACFLALATRLAETIAWYVAVGAAAVVAAVAAAIVAVFANMLSLNR